MTPLEFFTKKLEDCHILDADFAGVTHITSLTYIPTIPEKHTREEWDRMTYDK